MNDCPYRGCHGDRAHGTSHLFEAPQIEAFEDTATRVGAQREREAIVAMFFKKPRLTREALVAAIRERGVNQ